MLLAFHFCLWLAVSLTLDMHPDMVDHWVWSKFLAFGYFEHPPMVALTMRIATIIGGHNELTLEIGSVLFSVIILLLSYRVGVLFFNRRTAMMFVVILECTPYFSAGSVFWHINQPYMVCWLLELYIIGKYIRSRNLNWIFAFGVVAGLGAMSKYIMILFPLCLLVWCVINREQRRVMIHWKTYLAAIIALLIVAPNIYWNSQRDWVTFNFVLEKGLTGARFGEHFLHLTVSQLVLYSIFFTLLFWLNLFRRKIRRALLFNTDENAGENYTFLLITGLLPVLFFSLTSFAGSRTDPSWLNVAYFSILLLTARLIETELLDGRIKKYLAIFSSAFIFNLLLVGIFLAQVHFYIFPLDLPDAPSLNSLLGWRDTAEKIEQIYETAGKPLPEFVISREYQVASALGFYLKNQPTPHSLEKAARNEWSPVDKVKEAGAGLVCEPDECESVMAKAKTRFGPHFRYLDYLKVQHFGNTIRELKVYHLDKK